jgi:hypothetical protein
MKRRVTSIVLLAPLAVAVACFVGWAAEREGGNSPSLPPLKVDRTAPLLLKEGRKPSGLTPLKVDKTAPLLLDDAAGLTKKPAAKPGAAKHADNSACFVCHGNYQEESMALSHAIADVGCVKCHGDSFAHRNDEDNVTPPDTMYAEADIAANCAKCHDTHDAAAVKVIAKWQERCPAKTNPADLLCTDCHGEHRLSFRTVWWDKKTRKLVVRKQDEQVKRAPDLTKKPGKPAG